MSGTDESTLRESLVYQFFANLPLARFVDEYFHRLPFAAPADAGWSQVEWIEKATQLLALGQADLLVVRQGVQRFCKPPIAEQERRSLLDEGWTIVVRHAERLDPSLGRLAADFEESFNGNVDIHVYWTPAKQFGFGWHYDVEDVFLFQCVGVKHYSLRKNTVNPWPTAESFPQNLRYENEIMPLVRCTLAAGDSLYIPVGYWHKAEAEEESLSLAIGVTSPTRLDALAFLRQKLASDLQWRARLPVVGTATGASQESLHKEFTQLVGEIAKGVQRALTDADIAGEFIRWLRSVGKTAEVAQIGDDHPSKPTHSAATIPHHTGGDG